MRTTRMALVIGGALLAATSTAGAQRRDDVPPSMMPSAGMCRVWIDGIPVLREPPQTDCATARRTAPAGARILYGPQTGNVQNDPRRGQVGSQVGSNNPRYDQRTIAERQRIERERQRLALERQRAQQREQLRLANQQREQNRLRAEQQRRDEWKRTHPNASDSRDHRRDDHDKNDDHSRGNSGNSGSSTQGVDPRRVPR